MLDWIIKNTEWLFSGVGVRIIEVILTVFAAIAGWLFLKRSKDERKKTSTYSVHQTNSGGGDNVGRDKITKE